MKNEVSVTGGKGRTVIVNEEEGESIDETMRVSYGPSLPLLRRLISLRSATGDARCASVVVESREWSIREGDCYQ